MILLKNYIFFSFFTRVVSRVKWVSNWVSERYHGLKLRQTISSCFDHYPQLDGSRLLKRERYFRLHILYPILIFFLHFFRN